MKYIDISTWNRREHFEFFSTVDVPFYSLTVELDVTKLRRFTSENRLSFYYSMIYLCTKALHRVENFMYRIRGDKVVLLDKADPSFTFMKPGEELFRYTVCKLTDDIFSYSRACAEAAAKKDFYMDAPEDAVRDDLIYYTCTPWFSFTSLTHEYCFNRDDTIPRLAWGKYFERDGRTVMNFSIQANHRVVDGYHIGKFLEELNRELDCIGS